VDNDSVNHKPLAHLPVRDLVVLVYIVGTGISRLRQDWRVDDDLAALRRELRTREQEVAA
jgi:hypothetical protein